MKPLRNRGELFLWVDIFGVEILNGEVKVDNYEEGGLNYQGNGAGKQGDGERDDLGIVDGFPKTCTAIVGIRERWNLAGGIEFCSSN